MMISEKDQARFWAKVSLPNAEGCMFWTGVPLESGYAHFSVQNRRQRVNRFSLLLAEGDPPAPDYQAAHGCRNRHCVAPEHLSWKTGYGNQADRLRDGTDNQGERNGRAKLTIAQVSDIRERYQAGGVFQRQLGTEYGVSQSLIHLIVTNQSWRSA